MEAPRRGPYAKGIEKRGRILEEALAAYSESDSSGASLRSIAARVGLSERGLLHYFSSRDELFVSILRERDEADRRLVGDDATLEELAAVQVHSAGTPGLIRLFVEMSAAAPDVGNPAHEFFTTRYRRLRKLLARLVGGSVVAAGRPAPSAEDAAFAARMLIAASDGLQMQWLLEPSIDLRADLDRLARILTSESALQ